MDTDTSSCFPLLSQLWIPILLNFTKIFDISFILCYSSHLNSEGISWRQGMFEILKRQEMAGGTVVLNEISAPLIAQKAKPGQFVILKANETGERIPLTMADTDAKTGTITKKN